MPTLRVQHELKLAPGFEASAPTNTFWFQTTTVLAAAEDIADTLSGLYDGIRSLFPAQVEEEGHRIRVYDMADPEPRAPVLDTTYDLTSAPGGYPLPFQCSIVLSFQAPRVSGTDQARRRGRVYLGPLKNTLTQVDGSLDGTTTTAVAGFGAGLLSASVAAADWQWVVWSRTNEAHYAVENGWVDNVVDIQRRRQQDSSGVLRTTWGGAP